MSVTTTALSAIVALLLIPSESFADDAAHDGSAADGAAMGAAADERPIGADRLAPAAASAPAPGPSAPLAPRVVPPPRTWTPVVVDPQAAAVDRGLRNQARWPLAYVDRPQTLYEGMESFSVAGRQLFGGPPGYRRSILDVDYGRGLTDVLELGLGLSRLYCGGSGLGDCQSLLAPGISLRYAALTAPERRLVLGASIDGFGFSARGWARLKLVVPKRLSLEIEPRLSWGIGSSSMPAWWNTAVTQDGNQSRASLIVDGNLQLGERVVAWLDAVPYLPTARLGDPTTTALELGGGLSVSVVKGFELAASCWRYDVLTARRWEYVPRVSECSLDLIARRFGPSPENDAKVVAPSPDPY